MPYPETLNVLESLAAGDRVKIDHEVKVGFRQWNTQMEGTIVRKERRRHGLHIRRNFDDKVFSDVLILKRDSGELTTITIDEFTVLTKVS